MEDNENAWGNAPRQAPGRTRRKGQAREPSPPRLTSYFLFVAVFRRAVPVFFAVGFFAAAVLRAGFLFAGFFFATAIVHPSYRAG